MKTYNSTFRFLLLVPVLIVGMVACQKELPFDQEVVTPKLVVNGLFTQDSVWKVHLSRSLSVIDEGELQAVSDGNVVIKNAAGNQVAALQYEGDGVYAAASEMPAIDVPYTIEASAPGYATVTATDRIPGSVQILSLDTLSKRGPQGDDVLEFSLTFTDPAGLANYYMIQLTVSVTYVEPGFDTIQYSYPQGVYCNDPNLENVTATDNYHRELLLNDQSIDGQTYTLKFEMPDIGFGSGDELDGVLISLISSSETFFNYRKSYQAYQQGEGNPFAQPVQVYSNVEGGFGIFAGGSQTTWWLEN